MILIGIYVAFRTLAALTMTVFKVSGVPANYPVELTAYYVSMPWTVILFGWASLFISVAAMALLAFGRPGATRTLSAAIVIDIGAWIWERSVTPYTEVFTARQQSLDALMFLAMISIVALMALARRRGTLT